MRKYIALLVLVCTIFLVMTPQAALAQEASFEENFSGDLSQWQFLRDDGRYWKIIDQGLESYVPFGSTLTELVPTAQSWSNSITDLIYEFDFTALQGADKNISFGITDKDNWYEVHFTPSLTEIARVKNGQAVWTTQTPYVLPMNTTQHHSITFDKGHIILKIDGSTIVDVIDPTFENNYGKIGLKATTGGIYPTRVRFDNVAVKQVGSQPTPNSETKLGVALIKQTDPLWANLEYDTASKWAPSLGAGTGFKDWACNLVSQLMLMKYHGVTHFPNGEVITPISLNKWLLEHQGYYNSPLTGNIKRQSISQLSAVIAKDSDTPKLEFKYVGTDLINTAVAEIEKGNPVILELDGHFVVADGFSADKQDLYIKDPAFEYTKLSDHHLSLKSVRLFTPSHTDLSYITVSSAQGVAVAIEGSADQSIAAAQYQESLTAASNVQIVGPPTLITEIAQPTSGNYTIALSNTTEHPQAVTVTTYTADGQSQILLDTLLKPGSHRFDLLFDKSAGSTLTEQQSTGLNLKEIRKQLREMKKNYAGNQNQFLDTIDSHFSSLQSLTATDQQKLLQILKTAIVSAPELLLPEPTKVQLLEFVRELLDQLK